MNIEKIERNTPMYESQVTQEDVIEEVKIEKPETTICEICGVDYRGSTKEEHEARQFHQDRLN